MKYIITIKISERKTKTSLIDSNRNSFYSITSAYPIDTESDDALRFEPEICLKTVTDSLRQVISKSGVNPEDIIAIGICSSVNGMVLLDSDGEIIYAKTSKPDIFENNFALYRYLRLRDDFSGIYDRCRHLLSPKDYIIFKLTGSLVADVTTASLSGFLDIEKRSWNARVLQEHSIDSRILPAISESGEFVGKINSKTMILTGISEGTKVIAGCTEISAAMIGAGCFSGERTLLNLDAIGNVSVMCDSFVDGSPLGLMTLCSAAPNSWNVHKLTKTAGVAFDWFVDNFCESYKETASESKKDLVNLIERDLRGLPAGSRRLIFMPYISGEIPPYSDTVFRGVFFGLTDEHSVANLAKSVIEGIAFALKDALESYKKANITFNNAYMFGKLSKSIIFPQIFANVFPLCIFTEGSDDIAEDGIAALVLFSAGLIGNISDFSNELVKKSNQYLPETSSCSKYEQLYAIFRNLSKAIDPIFQQLNCL